MSDRESKRPEKSLKERLEEVVRDLLDALGSLVAPEPELVPVPARGRRGYPARRPYRR